MVRQRKPSNPDPLDTAARRAVGIRRRLGTWFARQRRDLPWRRTRDPYAIWLSEMMLQQTQVATVIPFYQRFMNRFPNVGDLAAAGRDEVLRHWAGLGYYARARHLHRAARIVVDDYGGRFPPGVKELQSLPGVGAYTAGAVASIAFDQRAVVVDGNVARVLARLFEIDLDIRDGPGRRLIGSIAERLLPRRHCGDFNQALMELGATVCLPKTAARCEVCPLKSVCGALSTESVARLPSMRAKGAPRRETHVVSAIHRGGRWLVVRRPEQGLWAGLWELPTAVLNGEAPRTAAGDLAAGFIGSKMRVEMRPFCTIEHRLTHRTITFVGHVFRASVHRTAQLACKRTVPHKHTSDDRPIRWLSLEDVCSLGISTAMRKVVGVLQESLVHDRAPRAS